MKILKKILLLLLIVFIIAQFFSPEKNEDNTASIVPFFENTNPPEEVNLILKQNCFDCHSNFTRYPWYSSITPVNYWMAGHIDHAKEELNFSNWNAYTIKKKDHKLDELIEMVEEKEMPLPSYTWMHGEANLTDTQIESVITWAKQVRSQYVLEPETE
ncbi:MAG: cytochrome C [Bacteroidetes bacterium]|nr:MAG: cytochrome C [Bacteroidota bacterium]